MRIYKVIKKWDFVREVNGEKVHEPHIEHPEEFRYTNIPETGEETRLLNWEQFFEENNDISGGDESNKWCMVGVREETGNKKYVKIYGKGFIEVKEVKEYKELDYSKVKVWEILGQLSIYDFLKMMREEIAE